MSQRPPKSLDTNLMSKFEAVSFPAVPLSIPQDHPVTPFPACPTPGTQGLRAGGNKPDRNVTAKGSQLVSSSRTVIASKTHALRILPVDIGWDQRLPLLASPPNWSGKTTTRLVPLALLGALLAP